MPRVVSYGSCIPCLRLTHAAIDAGKGESAVTRFDRDAMSMTAEARDAVSVDTLLLATLSPPFAAKLNAVTVPAALDLPEAIAAVEVGGWSRMGLARPLLGHDLAATGRRALVCAAVGAPGGGRESVHGHSCNASQGC